MRPKQFLTVPYWIKLKYSVIDVIYFTMLNRKYEFHELNKEVSQIVEFN